MRRDFLVSVSPPARTDRQTMMTGGMASRSTCDQVRARSSSVRAPVSSDTTPQNRMENLKRIGAQRLSLIRQPAVHVVSRQLAELAGSQRGKNVRIGKNRAFGDRALASTGQAELEPVADGQDDGSGMNADQTRARRQICIDSSQARCIAGAVVCMAGLCFRLTTPLAAAATAPLASRLVVRLVRSSTRRTARPARQRRSTAPVRRAGLHPAQLLLRPSSGCRFTPEGQAVFLDGVDLPPLAVGAPVSQNLSCLA